MAERVRIELPPRRDSPRRARLALEPLRSSVPPDGFAEVCLVVSELVADAVLVDEGDGADPVELAASADGDLVRIEVTAVAAAFEGLARGPKPADRGWGIYLLERLGYSWEVERADESARVRAEKQLAGG